MADKIVKYFKNRKIEKQFKKAGPGHKLSEDKSTSTPASDKASSSADKSVRAAPSETAARAGAAALARLQPQKEVDWSLAAIKAQARKELELEQQAAAAKAKSEELKPQVKEIAPVASKGDALLFKCPMLGEHVLPMNELKAEIKKFLFEQIAEEKGLSAALIIVTCNDNESAVKACTTVICKYLGNIIENPDEEKYRKIKLSNKVFLEKVQPIIGSKEFLEASGFEEHLIDGEQFLVLSSNADRDLLPALRDALMSAEPLEIILDRNVKIFLPSNVPKEIVVPEEYFRITSEEIAREQAAKTRDMELSLQLRTKAMRDRDAKRECISYKYTMVRIRLPNGFILQGTFNVTDQLSDVFDFLNECLAEGCSNPVLKSGVQTLNAYSESLLELKLVPAVVLNCLVDVPQDSDILRPEFLGRIEQL